MIKLKFIYTISIFIIVYLVYANFSADFNAIKEKNKNIFEYDSNTLTIIENIDQNIKNQLQRLNTMSLQEWFDYLNKNKIVEIDKNKYYFYVFESITKDNVRSRKCCDFQLKVHHDTKFINMMWDDMYQNQENNFIFVKQKQTKT